ncbi:MAG: hypothetical protein KF901_26650 [Myxococcales bacterium]|nr:hypothetical protein [Myxococcales bacterium]
MTAHVTYRRWSWPRTPFRRIVRRARSPCPARRNRRATVRPPGARILRLYLHNSRALGLPGIDGALASARFVMRQRGFPWWPYHLRIPYERLEDADGRLVLLRMAPDPERTWSQGARANDEGVSAVLQGNTSRLPISPAQHEGLQALIPWASERYGWWPWSSIEDWLSTHLAGWAPRWPAEGLVSGHRRRAVAAGIHRPRRDPTLSSPQT